MTYIAKILFLIFLLYPNVGHIRAENLDLPREKWGLQCKSLISQKLYTIKNIRFINDLEETIPNGIALGFTLLEIPEIDPQTALNFCRLAVATAIKESTMNPSAKNGTCLGLYQIQEATANELLGELGMRRNARNYLYSPTLATAIYVVLITKFALKYHTLEKIFVRYTSSKKHAKKMLKIYKEIAHATY